MCPAPEYLGWGLGGPDTFGDVPASGWFDAQAGRAPGPGRPKFSPVRIVH